MEIIGRITADANVKTLKDERKVVNFNVAVNESFKPKGSNETKKFTTFFQCAYWINAAIAPFLTKGSLVQLNGRLGVNAYKDMHGEPKASLNFHVNSIKLHGKNQPSKPESKSDSRVTTAQISEPLEDLPF